LQQYGTPYDVYSRPANKTVADFMGLINVVAATVMDSSTVRIGELTMTVPLPAGCSPGEAVDFTVRPECIRLVPPSSEPDLVTATVSEHTFLGNINEYYVTLQSGQALRVQTHPNQHLTVGDPVAVAIDAHECCVFRRETPAQS
jgi:ABC-type Fe3+/spermidine/putrescine transport system ATPase subunit